MKQVGIIATVIVFFVFAGYLSARQLFRRMERETRIQVKATDAPSELSSLLADLKGGSSIGDIVFLREIRIEPGPASGLFYAVDCRGARMLVLSSVSTIRSFEGRIANLSGAITRFPSLAAMQQEWKLKKTLAAEMRHDGAYIRLDRIWPDASIRARR
jgi:hypothetical protein